MFAGLALISMDNSQIKRALEAAKAKLASEIPAIEKRGAEIRGQKDQQKIKKDVMREAAGDMVVELLNKVAETMNPRPSYITSDSSQWKAGLEVPWTPKVSLVFKKGQDATILEYEIKRIEAPIADVISVEDEDPDPMKTIADAIAHAAIDFVNFAHGTGAGRSGWDI